jgi:proline iminopeptidase
MTRHYAAPYVGCESLKIRLRCLVFSVLCLGCVEQVEQPASAGFVEVEGGRIWYETIGSGEEIPLLVIHGGPGDQSCGYLETLSELSMFRPVIVYDQLGSGRSDRPTDTTLWNVPRFVDEVTRLREALGIDEVHILGHSWGGSVALEYMLTAAPVGVRSLSLAGPLVSTERWLQDANFLRNTLPAAVQEALTAGEESAVFDSPEYMAATDSFYTRFLVRSGWPRPDPTPCEGRGGFNTDVYEYMWGPTEFTATGTLLEFDRVDRLGDIEVPVLFIVGRYDEARPETMLEFQGLIAGSLVEVVEDAGHMSMEDQPERFNTAVQEFLMSVEGR